MVVWRLVIVVFGICAIAWAVDATLVYRAEAPLTAAAQRILLGEKFNPVLLSEMLSAAPATPVQASTLSSAAIIRLLLLEEGTNRQRVSIDRMKLQMTVRDALGRSPMNSFLWLTELWLSRQSGESEDSNLKLLGMSYWSAPNEGWIAARRNPVALDLYPSLAGQLAEQTVSEFVRLVRSGFYEDASISLVGPGWPIRQQLVGLLAQVDASDRRAFAKVFASKHFEAAVSLGLAER